MKREEKGGTGRGGTEQDETRRGGTAWDSTGQDGMAWHRRARHRTARDGTGRDKKGREGKVGKYWTGIPPHLDNITEILDVTLLCINQFIHNISVDQICSS